jgi:hypothetical protein
VNASSGSWAPEADRAIGKHFCVSARLKTDKREHWQAKRLEGVENKQCVMQPPSGGSPTGIGSATAICSVRVALNRLQGLSKAHAHTGNPLILRERMAVGHTGDVIGGPLRNLVILAHIVRFALMCTGWSISRPSQGTVGPVL